jgi:hypothetical protein
MIIPYIDIPFGTIHLYQKPINIRWGEKKLTQLYRAEVGRDPKIYALLLFYNRKRDMLKLFWLDGNGSQEISKMLPRGGFMLPAPKNGETFVKIERSKLNSIFRSRT